MNNVFAHVRSKPSIMIELIEIGMDWAIPYGAHTGPRNLINGHPTGKLIWDPSNSDGLPNQNYLSGFYI